MINKLEILNLVKLDKTSSFMKRSINQQGSIFIYTLSGLELNNYYIKFNIKYMIYIPEVIIAL